MIPKLIHYCWFGDSPLPRSAKKAIESWKLHCPEYELIEWNENNFDVSSCKYTYEAYRAKKFAFVSDYARLCALHRYGGVYLDVDYELIKPLDPLLPYDAFFGFEASGTVTAGILGGKAQMELFAELLAGYTNRSFVDAGDVYDLTPITVHITECLRAAGFVMNGETQQVESTMLFAREYFMPLNGSTLKMDCLSSHSYGFHYFNASWLPLSARVKIKIKRHLPQGVVKLVQRKGERPSR